jgi:hypothetical protein
MTVAVQIPMFILVCLAGMLIAIVAAGAGALAYKKVAGKGGIGGIFVGVAIVTTVGNWRGLIALIPVAIAAHQQLAAGASGLHAASVTAIVGAIAGIVVGVLSGRR